MSGPRLDVDALDQANARDRGLCSQWFPPGTEIVATDGRSYVHDVHPRGRITLRRAVPKLLAGKARRQARKAERRAARAGSVVR